MNELARLEKAERHYTSENSFYVELNYTEEDTATSFQLAAMTLYVGIKGFVTEDGFRLDGSKSEGDGQKVIRVYFSRIPFKSTSPLKIASKEIKTTVEYMDEPFGFITGD